MEYLSISWPTLPPGARGGGNRGIGGAFDPKSEPQGVGPNVYREKVVTAQAQTLSCLLMVKNS